jgi:hypothetical protein
MWVLFARAQPPDAPYWSGRRWLAAVDAVMWPGLWVLAVQRLPAATGLVGALVCTWAVAAGLHRLQTALRHNNRYRFTTWRWGKLLGWVLLIGALLRLFLGR